MHHPIAVLVHVSTPAMLAGSMADAWPGRMQYEPTGRPYGRPASRPQAGIRRTARDGWLWPAAGAFANFIGHAGKSFWPMLNGGADAVVFGFLWLDISAARGGPWRLDAALKRR